MVQVAVVFHSGSGHTQQLAQAVAGGSRRNGATVELVKTDELHVHDEGPWDLLNAADAIIFGSPTYMGAAAASFKAFSDASSRTYLRQGWKDKLAAGFTNSGNPSGDKFATLNEFFVLACQHGMLWVSPAIKPGFTKSGRDYETAINRTGHYTGVGTHSFTDQGPDLAPNAAELETGKLLGQRVTEAAKRWRLPH